MKRAEQIRAKEIVPGVLLLLVVGVVVVATILGWRSLPGLLGEWLGVMIGLVTTPFVLETSFLILGLMIVILLNVYRQKRDGDELVYLEQVEGPDVPQDLPERSRWAVYARKPLEGEVARLLDQAEGEWAIGDGEAAVRTLLAMPEEELGHPDTLELRIQIARATGKAGLAERLERERAAAMAGGETSYSGKTF